MNSFSLKNGQLHAESVPLSAIAERFGTPCYVYSRAALEAAFDEFKRELDGIDSMICYAVKANSNLAILNVFARLGAGFDIVSLGELKRALAAGADPKKIVFSGVGKSASEMAFALETGIHCFNVESAPELERLNAVAGGLGKVAPVSLRVNPNVDAKTHPYISTGLKENKFGVAYEDALKIYQQAAALPNLEVVGIDCHIGSQLLDPAPFAEALDKLLQLIDQLRVNGIELRHIDLGGGLRNPESRRAHPDDVTSVPFRHVLDGMLNPAVQARGPRPVNMRGFLSVMGQSVIGGNQEGCSRFGQRSYAIVSDRYLNFSSRVGYHYAILDTWCGESLSKNYIRFEFAGGAASDEQRVRRVRCIGMILKELGLSKKVELPE